MMHSGNRTEWILRSRSRQWAVTLGAMAASTWALDAVATGAGALLAGSGLLEPLSGAGVATVLLVSYLAWGWGMRGAIRANLALLAVSGTSTNALSKLAWDWGHVRGWTPRLTRLTATIGYVLTEFAKEAPYYAGAFGLAALTESLSAGDAVIFLAGANFGAAIYETGQGRIISRLAATLDPRPRPRPDPALPDPRPFV
jgi:hypothetical protein